MLLHFRSSDENLKHSPVKSATVFQSKLETVMYARGLRGLVVSRNAVFEPPHGNGEGNEVETTTEKVK